MNINSYSLLLVAKLSHAIKPIQLAKRVIQQYQLKFINFSSPSIIKLINPINQTNIMSTLSFDQLEKERQQLESRITELVDKLEAKKKSEEIKVPKEAILRSREEIEATSAIEKLTVDEDKPEIGPSIKAPDVSEKTKAKPKKGGGKEPPAPEKPIDVSRLDLRIGKIVEVQRHPDADALYVEKIDCGDTTGPRTIISGLVKHVPIEQMQDRLVVVLCNLKPAKMRGILSEGMVMCASCDSGVELLQPPDGAKPGDRVVFDNYPGEPDEQLNPKKKVWEQVAPDIKTNDDGVAFYKECEFKLSGNVGKFKSNLKNVHIR